jgi:hypothetical protein
LGAPILVYLHSRTDWILLAPVIGALRETGIGVRVLVNTRRGNLGDAAGAIAADGIHVATADDRAIRFAPRRFLADAEALLLGAETSAGAHRTPHRLAKAAWRNGVLAATVQHGLENVGLEGSETNPVGSPADMIASQIIYLWKDRDDLPKDVAARAIVVGRPRAPVARPRPGGIVLFAENLHAPWYSEGDRMLFLDLVAAAAERAGASRVRIRPHPDGGWWTRAVANWPDLRRYAIEHGDFGRTIEDVGLAFLTPSTLALDLAEIGLPLAIIADGPLRPAYAGLANVRRPADIAAAIDRTAINSTWHVEAQTRFLARSRIEGDAAGRIAADLVRRLAERPQ